MARGWGRSPRNEFWKDMQALAVWVLIIGVVGFLIFPGFFKDIYARLTDQATETSALNEYSLNNSSVYDPDLYNQQYLYGQNSSEAAASSGIDEIASGYWIIFVAEEEFKQLEVSSEAYDFLLRLIESDQSAEGQTTVMLTANGHLRKFTVSAEIEAIIQNMAIIVGRDRIADG